MPALHSTVVKSRTRGAHSKFEALMAQAGLPILPWREAAVGNTDVAVCCQSPRVACATWVEI